MEGITKQSDGIERVVFPPVTEHEINKLSGDGECFDCPVRKQCRKEENLLGENGEKVAFPAFNGSDAFSNTIKLAYNLHLLSYHSLIHIMPKETFSDQTVFTINKPGYYRIFMIYTDRAWDDCICRSCAIKIDAETENIKTEEE